MKESEIVFRISYRLMEFAKILVSFTLLAGITCKNSTKNLVQDTGHLTPDLQSIIPEFKVPVDQNREVTNRVELNK